MKKLLLLLPFLLLACAGIPVDTTAAVKIDNRSKPVYYTHFYYENYNYHRYGGRFGLYGRYGGPKYHRDLTYLLRGHPHYRYQNRQNSYKKFDKRHRSRYNKYYKHRESSTYDRRRSSVFRGVPKR